MPSPVELAKMSYLDSGHRSYRGLKLARRAISSLAFFVLCVLLAAQSVWAEGQAGSVEELQQRAAQGDVQAQLQLGLLYAKGEGVRQDYAAALKWYRLAAAQGNAQAEFSLGVLYAKGEGVAQDEAAALKWYHLAAAQGNAEAELNLGLLYATGQGVSQNEAEAVKWFRLAASHGNAGAQFNLGVLYYQGQGVPQNTVQAYKWLTLAAAGFPGQAERDSALKLRDQVAADMTPAQIAQAQQLVREGKTQ